ncbi:hypothetical protein QPM17_22000 [Marinobacter sp. TBZ242]|uniref:Uncharacterized protein n=1 Tax=Marinobacter azerbaijanicus TaxID=3050455 RepID=A0ABT7IKZ4_9GAMM|nr:hypothetical protein [Marinobacter sp. TBZ242]MDL0433818.1 hypothetical protein [Marinobacter sp. TBZ242]
MTCLTEITESVFGIKRHLNDNGFPLKVGHVRELLAASLGFKTFASLQHAWNTKFEDDFHEAIFVLDQQTFDHRAIKLGLDTSAEMNDVFLQAVQLEWRRRFADDMIIEWEVGEALNQDSNILHYPLDDHFSSEIASSNAIIGDEVINPYTATLPPGPLADFVELNIGYSAHMEMLDDKPITTFMEEYFDNGFKGELTALFSTTGFRGLIFMEFEGGSDF